MHFDPNTGKPVPDDDDLKNNTQNAQQQGGEDGQNQQWGDSNQQWGGQNQQWGDQNQQWGDSNQQWGDQNQQWNGQNQQWGDQNQQWGDQNQQWNGQNQQWGDQNQQWGDQNQQWNGQNQQWGGQNQQWNGQNQQWNDQNQQWNGQNQQWGDQNQQWNGQNQQWNGQNSQPGGRKPQRGGKFTQWISNNRKKFFIIIGAAAAAACVAVIIINAAANPQTRIVKAAQRTFSMDDELIKQLSGMQKMVDGNNFSITGSVTAEDMSMDLDYHQDIKGQSAVLGMEAEGERYEFTEVLDSKTLTIDPGPLYGQPLQYNYTEDKSDSALAELVGIDALEEADRYLSACNKMTSESADTKALMQDIQELEFEKNGTMKIGGVTCTCYETTLTEEWLDDYCQDAMGSLSADEADDLTGVLTNGEVSGWSEAVDALADSTAQFYIGGKKLRGIVFETEDSGKVSITLSGEEIPWYKTEMEVTDSYGDSSDLRLNVTEDGDERIYEVSADNGTEMTLVYDTDTREFSLSSEDEELLSGLLQVGSSGFELQIDAPDAFSMDMTLKKGGSLAKIEGTPVDVTEWTEDEWINFVSELENSAASIAL